MSNTVYFQYLESWLAVEKVLIQYLESSWRLWCQIIILKTQKLLKIAHNRSQSLKIAHKRSKIAHKRSQSLKNCPTFARNCSKFHFLPPKSIYSNT